MTKESWHLRWNQTFCANDIRSSFSLKVLGSRGESEKEREMEEAAEKDSVIKDLLGIKENRPTDMIIQFWESPLGYSGYKLSRNTLVLYGLSDQFKYTVYFKGNNYYLATKELFYVLKETSDFLSFKSADRNAILND